jgi:hypothetical protein
MTFPTLHMNGTNGDDLISSLCDAMSAIQAAERKLGEAAPNGRDYYVQGPTALDAATKEHYSRLQRLHAVREELGEIVSNICDQQDAIAERKRGVR